MKNYDELVKINHYPNWPYIPDHPYRTLNIGGSVPGKANALLNLIKTKQTDIDKTICQRSIRIKVSIAY